MNVTGQMASGRRMRTGLNRHPEIQAGLRLLSKLTLQDRKKQAAADQLLARLLRWQSGVVVQVGAYDGVFDDPLRPHLASGKIEAVLIEPQIEAYRSLKRLYKDTPRVNCVRAAIGPETTRTTLWSAIHGNNGDFGRAIASENPVQVTEGIRRHPGLHMLLGYQIVPEFVRVEPLADVLHKHRVRPEDVSVFVSDTEGSDAMVMGQLLDYGSRPDFMQFEHLHAPAGDIADVTDRLATLGYNTAQTYKDTFVFRGSLK